MTLRPEIKRHVENILDTFAGADGGGKFMDFRVMIETLDRQAAEGDQVAATVLQTVARFSRLLDVAAQGAALNRLVQVEAAKQKKRSVG